MRKKNQLIRDASFRAKTTWLLRLLGFGPIDESHLNLLQFIYDSRNAFVHYKWKSDDVDDEFPRRERKRLGEAVRRLEGTIKYLHSLESRYFFKGKEKALAPAILRRQSRARRLPTERPRRVATA